MKFNRKLNTVLTQMFVALLLLLGSVGVSGQNGSSCYKIEMSESGYGTSLYSDDIKSILCDSVSIVDKIDGNGVDFHIVSYDLGSVDKFKKPIDVDAKVEEIKADVNSKYSEYLAIIKRFKDGDLLSFHVFLKLDTTAAKFDSLELFEIDAIASSVESMMNSVAQGVKSTKGAEWQGIKVFNRHMRAIKNGTFDINKEALILAVSEISVPLLNVSSATYFEESENINDWDGDGLANDIDNYPLSYSPDHTNSEGNVRGRDGYIKNRDCDVNTVINKSHLKTVTIKEFGYDPITIERFIDDIKSDLRPRCDAGLTVKVIIIDTYCSLAKFHEYVSMVNSFDYGMVITVIHDSYEHLVVKDKLEIYFHTAK